jgi:hypothetical protein
VTQFNPSAAECHDLGDHGSAAVFEEMVRDEEKHADWFVQVAVDPTRHGREVIDDLGKLSLETPGMGPPAAV